MYKSIKDLKKWYFIFFETGLILALVILLSAFSIQLGEERTYEPKKEDIGIPILVDIPTTTQKEIPATPPKPHVNIQKPKEHIFENAIDNIPDIKMDTGNKMPVITNTTENDGDVIFVPFEQGPKIIGGIKSIYKEIKYPRKAKLARIEGTVVVQFIVDKKGKVTNAKVIRGIGGGCDEEALRVVKNIEFQPARQRERYVKIKMRIPIKFQLKN